MIERFAVDFGTARAVDKNGYMHVVGNRLSRACVSPYRGYEIERWQELGLDANKIYRVYRPPEELAKAAHTFDGMPLMDNHVLTSSSELEKSKVRNKIVGAIGSGVKMVGDFLVGPLTIWTEGGLEGVRSKEQADISCGYRYSLDTAPGKTPEGEEYDMKMVDISANHVALVPLGRVQGAMVADSASMPHVHVSPVKLIYDASFKLCIKALKEAFGFDESHAHFAGEYGLAAKKAAQASAKADKAGHAVGPHESAAAAHKEAGRIALKTGNFGLAKEHQAKEAHHNFEAKKNIVSSRGNPAEEGIAAAKADARNVGDALREAFANGEKGKEARENTQRKKN